MFGALFGSELTRTPFEMLWAADERRAVLDLVQTVTEDMDGVVAGVTGSQCRIGNGRPGNDPVAARA